MLNVAVQMDPIETINIDGDSSFALMLEAQRRGHRMWHYDVRAMSLHEGRLEGREGSAGCWRARARLRCSAWPAIITSSGRKRRWTSARWTPC